MKSKALLLLLPLVIYLTSCTTTKPKPEPVSPSQIERVTKLSQLLNTKRRAAALNALEKLISENPHNTIGHLSNLVLGDFYFAKNEFVTAYNYYAAIINSTSQAENEIEARLGAGRSLVQLQKFPEAISILHRVLIGQSSREQQLEAHKNIYLAHMHSGNRIDALKSLVFLSLNSSNPTEKEAYKLRAYDLVDSRLTEDEVRQVSSQSQFEFLRGAAYFRLGTSLFEQGQYSDARSLLGSSLGYLKEGQMFERAGELIAQIEARRRTNPDVIGAVLPLTGRGSKMGEKALRGLQLGLGIFGSNKTRYKLSVVDSEGNPEIARRAFRRMVMTDSPIAVVGSLLSKTALPVATKAQEFGVPTIGLSQKSGITQVGEYVFRNATTSEMQVQRLVYEAMVTRKMSRFAILYPNDAYGVEFANLFWDEVHARGGQITGVQAYDPKETDFRGPIKRLVGTFFVEGRLNEYDLRLKAWRAKQKGAIRDLPKDLLPPVVDFEGIFIPDSTKALGQIAPMLAYNDIENVTLIGTNLWNMGGLVARGGKFVENSIFVDSMPSNPKDDGFFSSNFQRTFGYEPDTFELQAYDTGLMIRQLLDSGVSTRDQMRDRLARLSTFKGAAGALSMNGRREIERPLAVLTVEKGQIKPLH